jgi:hypothetical protein
MVPLCRTSAFHTISRRLKRGTMQQYRMCTSMMVLIDYYTIQFWRNEVEYDDEDDYEAVVCRFVEKQTTPDRLESVDFDPEKTWAILQNSGKNESILRLGESERLLLVHFCSHHPKVLLASSIQYGAIMLSW